MVSGSIRHVLPPIVWPAGFPDEGLAYSIGSKPLLLSGDRNTQPAMLTSVIGGGGGV